MIVFCGFQGVLEASGSIFVSARGCAHIWEIGQVMVQRLLQHGGDKGSAGGSEFAGLGNAFGEGVRGDCLVECLAGLVREAVRALPRRMSWALAGELSGILFWEPVGGTA